ncbi:hypothetical protein BHE74_00031005 [Ensete ventricosum]|nr:hypothetical protein BHE74_00031005 [Ensete ventricosum]
MPWANHELELCTLATHKLELRLGQIMSLNSSAQPLTNLSRNTRPVQNPSSTARPVQLPSCSARPASLRAFKLGQFSSRAPCSVRSAPRYLNLTSSFLEPQLGRISFRVLKPDQFSSRAPARSDHSRAPFVLTRLPRPRDLGQLALQRQRSYDRPNTGKVGKVDITQRQARLTARTTDDMVRCNGMVSNKKDKGFRYGYPVTVTIKAPTPLRSGGIAKSTTKLT